VFVEFLEFNYVDGIVFFAEKFGHARVEQFVGLVFQGMHFQGAASMLVFFLS